MITSIFGMVEATVASSMMKFMGVLTIIMLAFCKEAAAAIMAESGG